MGAWAKTPQIGAWLLYCHPGLAERLHFGGSSGIYWASTCKQLSSGSINIVTLSFWENCVIKMALYMLEEWCKEVHLEPKKFLVVTSITGVYTDASLHRVLQSASSYLRQCKVHELRSRKQEHCHSVLCKFERTWRAPSYLLVSGVFLDVVSTSVPQPTLLFLLMLSLLPRGAIVDWLIHPCW